MSKNSHLLLSEILQKPNKNLEDAQLIYAKIRSFRFFESFFSQNLKTMDQGSLMSLCKGFKYEKHPVGTPVFQKGEASNDKFYVILSGKVAILLPPKNQLPPRIPSGSGDKSPDSKDPKKHFKKETSLRVVIKGTLKKDSSLRNVKRGLKKELSWKGLPRKNSPEGTHIPFESKKTFESDEMKEDEVLSTATPKKAFAGPLSFLYPKEVKEEEKEMDQRKIMFLNKGRQFPNLLSKLEEEEAAPEEEVDMSQIAADPQKFEEFTSKYGKIVRFMETGESFGDLALKDNIPRQATVICNTDCEFLVVTKQQFDIIFLTKDREKEEFLRSTFPFLKTLSTLNFNALVYSFKTEVYTKGNYLAKEGQQTNWATKFFLIHHGECIVEKNIMIEVENPYDRTKPISDHLQPTQIAVIGQGMIAGEEITFNGNNYNYSVKALSESVIVHSVTKSEFDARFAKDFQEYLISMYQKKKAQRDIAIENIKKESKAKAEEIKARNIYTVQNGRIKDIITKPALQSLSRYIHRENQPQNSPNYLAKQFLVSKKNSERQLESSMLRTRASADDESFYQPDIQSPDLRGHKNKRKVDKKIDDFAHLPEILKVKDSDVVTPKDLEALKLFGSDSPKRKNLKRNLSIKPSNFRNEEGRTSPSSVGLKKSTKDAIFMDHEKASEQIDKKITNLRSVRSQGSTPTLMLSRIQEFLENTKEADLGSRSPSTIVSVKSWDVQRSRTAVRKSAFDPKNTEALIDTERTEDKTLILVSPTSPNRKFFASHSRGATKESLDVKHKKEFSYNESFYNLKDQGLLLNSKDEEEAMRESYVKGKMRTSCAEELVDGKTLMISAADLKAKLKKQKSQHDERLHHAKAWRQKVFQKTAGRRQKSVDVYPLHFGMANSPLPKLKE